MERKNLIGLILDSSNLEGRNYNFQIGEVIYGVLGLCGNESGNFAITEITDNTLHLVEKGGRHRIHKTDKRYVKPISKKFGIGFYYEDTDMPEFLNKDEMNKLIEEANQETKRIEEEKERRLVQNAELADTYREKYNYLNWFTPGMFINTSETIKNVRQYLKHNYSGEKFSVRKDGYDTIRVVCNNSSIRNKVNDELSIFIDHDFNSIYDCMDLNPSVFNKCFGGVKFLFVE